MPTRLSGKSKSGEATFELNKITWWKVDWFDVAEGGVNVSLYLCWIFNFVLCGLHWYRNIRVDVGYKASKTTENLKLIGRRAFWFHICFWVSSSGTIVEKLKVNKRKNVGNFFYNFEGLWLFCGVCWSSSDIVSSIFVDWRCLFGLEFLSGSIRSVIKILFVPHSKLIASSVPD
jgi:hypothetical protein